MSPLAWGTWVSVAVLIAGSLAVFTWFLVDVIRLFRKRGRTSRRPDG